MYLLKVRRLVPGATDTHGNAGDAWGLPQDWWVWWLAPGPVRELTEGRDASEIVWSVGAPLTDQVPAERDLVLIGSDEYQVDGRPQDWTLGPVPNPSAGVVAELRRVEG